MRTQDARKKIELTMEEIKELQENLTIRLKEMDKGESSHAVKEKMMTLERIIQKLET
ncbi:MAG: hypothetical protein ACLFUB_05780 [Cyclobacteriaceae bacterium]